MAKLALDNIPDLLYEELVARAQREGKTIEAAVVECIEAGIKADVTEQLERVRRFRTTHFGDRQFDHGLIQSSIDEGHE